MSTNKLFVGDELIAESYQVYNELSNIPKINNTPVIDNLTNDDIDIYSNQKLLQLLEDSKNIKVEPNESFIPEPNIQYYIGPNENGLYQVCYYTQAGEKISLGNTNILFEHLQKKIPMTNGKYDIGHINIEDEKILTKHSVVEAVNEIDIINQSKLNKTSNELTTTKKTVVGAINTIKTKLDGITPPLTREVFNSTAASSSQRTWVCLICFQPFDGYSDKFDSSNVTFWIYPYFSALDKSSIDGRDMTKGALLHYQISLCGKTGGYVEHLSALVNSSDSVLNKYDLDFITRHDGYSHNLYIGGNIPKGMQFKIEVVAEDISPHSWREYLNGEIETGWHQGQKEYTLLDIGYMTFNQ